jgi:predicted peroxiredoxin
MAVNDKPPRKKFAVQLSSGIKDVGRVKSALLFAAIAQCSGCDVVVYCVQDGADAVIKGKIREEGTLPPGTATFEQRLADARQVGVTFQLCQQVAKNRDLTEEDLIEGVQILGGIHLITYALEYDGMLSF